jgi:hypothetical protein
MDMPFGANCEYADFDACVLANKDKDDPQGYCATLMRETEEDCVARSVRMLRTKVYRPEGIKVIDESEGRVSAIVSSEKMDRDGDVIRAEGWELGNFNQHPVLLASHDYHSLRSQIGVWEKMEINGTTMKGVARFFIGKGNDEADWAFELAKEKALAFSVGFIPDMDKAVPLHKDDTFGVRGMEFKGQELLEVSAVTVPSNPDALQRIAKSPNLHPTLVEIAPMWTKIAEERLEVKQEEEEPEEEPEEQEEMALIELSEGSINAIAERIVELLEEVKPDEEEEEEADEEEDEDEEDVEEEGIKQEFDPYQVAVQAVEEALEEEE